MHPAKAISAQFDTSKTAMVSLSTVLSFALILIGGSMPSSSGHGKVLQITTKSRTFNAQAHRSLAACASSEHHRRLQGRLDAHIQAALQNLRNRRELKASEVLANTHKSDLRGAQSAQPSVLFGATPKCVLEPEVTEGPYYVGGEFIRTDIREKQPGVDLYVDLQFIDINTCQPVKDFYVDFWHCNSTGVYSGVVANGNGNSRDSSNINTTFHRGLAPTDADGVVQFMTKFPGHYTGRATHIHILGNYNGTVLPNKTYVGGKVSNVGQIFFDQDLITEVEKLDAYTPNTQRLTTNARDSILMEEAATTFDPVVNYVYLGDSVEDGIFSWITVGIDASASRSVQAAAVMTSRGGLSDSDDGFNQVQAARSSAALTREWIQTSVVGMMMMLAYFL